MNAYERAVDRLDEIAADLRFLAEKNPTLENMLRQFAERIQDAADDVENACWDAAYEEADAA